MTTLNVRDVPCTLSAMSELERRDKMRDAKVRLEESDELVE